jgi:hypothetical protein
VDKELKDKWTSALRSGEYSQGFGTLYERGQFCALGVLCREAGLLTDDDMAKKDKRNLYTGNYDLSPSYPDKFGILTEDESFILVDLNDNGRKSFAEIADYVEENL